MYKTDITHVSSVLLKFGIRDKIETVIVLVLGYDDLVLKINTYENRNYLLCAADVLSGNEYYKKIATEHGFNTLIQVYPIGPDSMYDHLMMCSIYELAK